jgi:hypothetical protein
MQNGDVTDLLTGMDQLDSASYSSWAIKLRSNGRNRTQAGSGGDRACERRRAAGLQWARADLSKGARFHERKAQRRSRGHDALNQSTGVGAQTTKMAVGLARRTAWRRRLRRAR